MPWKPEVLTKSRRKKKGNESSFLKLAEVKVDCFTLIAAPQRDLFLSLIISGIRYSSLSHLLSTEEMLKFVIIISYQNSFKRTYYVLKEHQPENCKAYYNKMKEVFGTFLGGKDVRYSASGINLEKLYFKDEEGEERLNSVVAEIMELFSWINCHTMEDDIFCDTDRSTITMAEFRARVGKTVQHLKEKKVQIQDFRMLLIMQTCALAGIGLAEHPILTKLIFVAKGTGGHKFLYGEEENERKQKKYGHSTDEIMSILGNALQLEKHDIGNAMECLACEAQPKRREGNVRDVFLKGQDLFTFDKFGRRYIKKYGFTEWEFLHAESHGCQYPEEQP
jgi:hypothetical protein